MGEPTVIDIETFSSVPIAHGTAQYSAGAELLLVSWSTGGEPARIWDVTAGEPMPEPLAAALTGGGPLIAWNSAFESWMLGVLLPHMPIAPNRWHCAMVRSLAHGLPGSLANACEVFGLGEDQAKLSDGKSLINLFCKPAPAKHKVARYDRTTHPEQWQRFVEYCLRDVDATVTLCRQMPSWNTSRQERAFYLLDQEINRRGVPIDTPMVDAMIQASAGEKDRLAGELVEATGGAVTRATQTERLKTYLAEELLVDLPNLQASTIDEALKPDSGIPDDARVLLANRAAASKASTTKYQAIRDYTSADSRMRFTLQFCGAQRTSRWAGHGPQVHNMPRPTVPDEMIPLGIDAVMNGDGGAGLVFGDQLMDVMSSAVRGAIAAPPGKKMVISDLANIEGRKQAWLAGESWKLQAFRDFDAGTGPDLYVASYAQSFNTPIDQVTKPDRQVGKVLELSMGYQGGVSAFISFALIYRIDLTELVGRIASNIPQGDMDKAASLRAFLMQRGQVDLSIDEHTWLVLDCIKRAWRRAHPAVVQYWETLENAIYGAVEHPGMEFPAGLCTVDMKGRWLRVRLPSGRYLCYPGFHLKTDEFGDIGMRYYGPAPVTRNWKRLATYGGKIFENICQASARDVLAYNMIGIEKAGYPVVLHLHDEVVTEVPDTPTYSVGALSWLLAAPLPWAAGLPLAAAGFETYRYRKD